MVNTFVHTGQLPARAGIQMPFLFEISSPHAWD